MDVNVDEAGGQSQTSQVEDPGRRGQRQALAHRCDAALLEDNGGTGDLLVGRENAGVDKSDDHGWAPCAFYFPYDTMDAK